MKKVLFVFLAVLFSTSCTVTYLSTNFEPVYMSKAEYRGLAKAEEPREISVGGKIWLHEKEGGPRLLFMVDILKGIHVIDITDSTNPVKKSFIRIPGNRDLAVSADGNYLFADSMFDLFVFNISDISAISKVETVEDCFNDYPVIRESYQEARASLDEGASADFNPIDVEKGVVVGWTKGETRYKTYTYRPGVCYDMAVMSAESGGTGGSTARFTTVRDHLYIVEWNKMKAFNISNPELIPDSFGTVDMGWGIETISPHRRNNGDYLLIGAMNGVYFYEIQDPLAPKLISQFTHVVARDPVIAAEDPNGSTFAFSTTRGWNASRLYSIDITDIHTPVLKQEKTLENPIGLTCEWPYLFVCDKTLKMFKIDSLPGDQKVSVNTESPVEQIAVDSCRDVISWNGTLIVTSPVGLTLFDYSQYFDPAVSSPKLVEKSKISWTESKDYIPWQFMD